VVHLIERELFITGIAQTLKLLRTAGADIRSCMSQDKAGVAESYERPTLKKFLDMRQICAQLLIEVGGLIGVKLGHRRPPDVSMFMVSHQAKAVLFLREALKVEDKLPRSISVEAA